MPSTTQKKPKAGGGEVLKSLPRTRPHTRSTKRAAASKPAATKPAPAKAKKTAVAKPKKKTAAKAAPKTRKANTKSKPAAKRKSTTARKAAPKKKAAAPVPPIAQTPTSEANSPIDLVANVVTRAGELAQVGASIGQAVVKNALSRLPQR